MTDTHPMDSQFRAITAQAWSGMLAVLLTMFIADMVRLAMLGQYSELTTSLSADPGRAGLWVLVCLICLNTLVQVAVHTFDAPLFRKAVFWVSALYTVFFMLHQAVHVASGESFGLHTVLDFTHHALGLWACWASRQWSTSALPGRASEALRIALQPHSSELEHQRPHP
jgi:hypothetical protein